MAKVSHARVACPCDWPPRKTRHHGSGGLGWWAVSLMCCHTAAGRIELPTRRHWESVTQPGLFWTRPSCAFSFADFNWYPFTPQGGCEACPIPPGGSHIQQSLAHTGTSHKFHDEFLPHPAWPAPAEERTGTQVGATEKNPFSSFWMEPSGKGRTRRAWRRFTALNLVI